MAEPDEGDTGTGKDDRLSSLLKRAGPVLGLIVAVLTVAATSIAIYEFWSLDAPSLLVRCQSLPARASLDPLVVGLLKSTLLAYSNTIKQVDVIQKEMDRRSVLLEVESSSDWKRYGYVACEISNRGSKLARDVLLSVEQSVTFYNGSELSKGTELKLGDMRPAAHRNVEYFSSGLMPISVFRPHVNVSHADGVANVSFGVTSYGWVGSITDALNSFSNEPMVFVVILLITIFILWKLSPTINRANSWIEARLPWGAARQARKRRPPER
jgi:hypothetical protein